MRIKFTKETTLDLNSKLNFLEDLSEIITHYSSCRSLAVVYICLHSLDPEMGIWRDFETGLVIHKKYTKTKRTLEFSYKLNYKQMTEAQTRAEVLDIILEGFKKTNTEIRSLNIKDFDIDDFYSNVSSVIENFAKNKSFPKESLSIAKPEEKKELPYEEKIKEIVFWEIIEQSKEGRKDFEHQAEILIDKLSRLSENDIIGFEFTFREMLAKSRHYNILAAVKIIEGYVNDDSFLYFRCRILAEGKNFYFKVIENPDYIADNPIRDIDGELMLSIADKAYIKKFGEVTDKELPREMALSFEDYDEVKEISGESWEENDLSKKYPKLWKKYKTESL